MIKLHKKSLYGGYLVFTGAVFWSLNAPLVKFLTLSPLLVCGLRSLIAGVVMLPLVRPKHILWNRWLFVYVVSFAALCISVIQALRMTDTVIAVGMQYTALVWLFCYSLLRDEQKQAPRFASVILIIIGMVLFMSSGHSGSSTGNLIALSEGIFFSCMTVSSKRIGKDNPLGHTAVANLLTGLFVFTFLTPSFHDLAILKPIEWVIMLILGVVQVGGGYGCYNLGLRYVTAQRASIIALWEMILGPVWVALFLHEFPVPLVLSGLLLILSGMLLDVIRIEK